MFHREVWAFLCLSVGLLVGAHYVGLPSRMVPLTADEPAISGESAKEGAIASLRRFAQSAAGLVAREPSAQVASVPPLTVASATDAMATTAATGNGPPHDTSTTTDTATPTVTYNVPLTALKPADGDASAAMTRDIQAELLRHGCYGGPMDGRWSASVKSAVGAFNARANSMLPIDGPDFALLNLTRSLATPVCMGQVATTAPATVPPAVEPTSTGAPSGTTGADSAEVTTVRLPAQPAPTVPGAMATVPTPANTRMSLGGQAPRVAPPTAPVTTAVAGAASATPPTTVNRDINLFLHPLGQQ